MIIERPLTPKEINEFSLGLSPPHALTRGQKGALIGIMNRAAGSNEGRKAFLALTFGKSSTAALLPSEWYALLILAGQYKDYNGEWKSSHFFDVEVSQALKGNQ